jgi:fucose 4-O-acetylase-like acetyltransferase
MSIQLNQNNFEVSFSRAFDQVKGMAILLVVLGHIASPYSNFIYSFHVPLFFFWAGCISIVSKPSKPIFLKTLKG